MADANQPPKDLIGFLDYYLVQKAPFQLPPAVKEWIVHYGPWITVVLLVLSLPVLLFALGIGSLFVPFLGLGYASGFGLSAILVLVQIGLMLAAMPGLFARKMSGWTMLFYAQLVGVVASLSHGSIVGGLFFGLISLYLLFQIRTLYKN